MIPTISAKQLRLTDLPELHCLGLAVCLFPAHSPVFISRIFAHQPDYNVIEDGRSHRLLLFWGTKKPAIRGGVSNSSWSPREV